MPFKDPAPSLLKLEVLDADVAVKQRLYSQNTAEFFGLDVLGDSNLPNQPSC